MSFWPDHAYLDGLELLSLHLHKVAILVLYCITPAPLHVMLPWGFGPMGDLFRCFLLNHVVLLKKWHLKKHVSFFYGSNLVNVIDVHIV